MFYKVCSNDDPRLGYHLWSWCVTLTKFVQMMILDWACIGSITFGLGMIH